MEPKRVLVDGANVLHAWPEFGALLPRQRDVARERLVTRLQPLHDSGLATVQVIFDGRGPSPTMDARAGSPPLVVIHTASGQTADDVIEQLVAQSASPGNCVVVTADRLERQTVEAAGASCISPDDLAAWIHRAELQVAARLRAHRRPDDPGR